MAIRNTAYFALLALIFGYPVPLIAAVLMSEVRRAKGLYSALAYLPVVVPPVVAVLLWKFFYDPRPEGVFNTIIGYVGHPAPTLAAERDVGDAVARARGHLGRGRRHRDHLPRRADRVPTELYDAAEVDGASVWGKIWHVTMPQLRGVLLITFILQIIGTAQVFLEPYLFTGGGPANATIYRAAAGLPVRVPEQPRRQLRHGDGAQPDARRVPRRDVPDLLPPHPQLEHLVTTTDPDASPRGRCLPGDGPDRRPPRRVAATPPAEDGPHRGLDRRLAPTARPAHLEHACTSLLLVLLVVWCVGPLLLLAKFAITPTQDILRTPLAIFPNGVKWSNLHDAWYDIDISKYFVNTVCWRAGLVGLADARRDDRRVRPVGAAPALGPLRPGARARDPLRARPSCCWSRST